MSRLNGVVAIRQGTERNRHSGDGLKASRQSFREFPAWIYWLLLLSLWALLIATATTLYINRGRLDLWKVALYAILLGAYLLAEKKAYQRPAETGQRAHESLRYLLVFAWWTLVFGALFEYALCPTSQPPITILGTGLTVAGMGLRVWGVRTLGQYYSGHIETWQSQHVIDTGPYRLIRHPGYVGNMLQVVGMPLVINAYLALLLSAIVVGLFLRRLLWEEEYLAQNLPGYRDYMARTRRIIPGVW